MDFASDKIILTKGYEPTLGKGFYPKDLKKTEFHKYYDEEAEHWLTIGHENGQSLGPKNVSGLGAYYHIIEENKADMISLSMLDILTEEGMYTEEEKKKMLVTFAAKSFYQGGRHLVNPIT